MQCTHSLSCKLLSITCRTWPASSLGGVVVGSGGGYCEMTKSLWIWPRLFPPPSNLRLVSRPADVSLRSPPLASLKRFELRRSLSSLNLSLCPSPLPSFTTLVATIPLPHHLLLGVSLISPLLGLCILVTNKRRGTLRLVPYTIIFSAFCRRPVQWFRSNIYNVTESISASSSSTQLSSQCRVQSQRRPTRATIAQTPTPPPSRLLASIQSSRPFVQAHQEALVVTLLPAPISKSTTETALTPHRHRLFCLPMTLHNPQTPTTLTRRAPPLVLTLPLTPTNTRVDAARASTPPTPPRSNAVFPQTSVLALSDADPSFSVPSSCSSSSSQVSVPV